MEIVQNGRVKFRDSSEYKGVCSIPNPFGSYVIKPLIESLESTDFKKQIEFVVYYIPVYYITIRDHIAQQIQLQMFNYYRRRVADLPALGGTSRFALEKNPRLKVLGSHGIENGLVSVRLITRPRAQASLCLASTPISESLSKPVGDF